MDRAIVTISKWQDNVRKRDTDIQQQLKKRYDVARIYLEFASGGDLWSWMNENCLELDPPEEFVFRIWECLLKALMVLKYGTENPHDSLFDKEPRKTHHQEIAHFDIKGPNSKLHSRTGVLLPITMLTLCSLVSKKAFVHISVSISETKSTNIGRVYCKYMESLSED